MAKSEYGTGFNDPNINKVSRFTDEQNQFFDMIRRSLMGEQNGFSDLYSPYDEQAARDRFQQTVANPAREEFREETVPTITGQFRGQNLGESSYAAQALGREGSRLESRLAGLQAQDLYAGREAAAQRRERGVQGVTSAQTFDVVQSPSWLDRILQIAGIATSAIPGSSGGGPSAPPRGNATGGSSMSGGSARQTYGAGASGRQTYSGGSSVGGSR